MFFNNLITGNTEIWTYAYDPFGRRLSKERQDKLAWTSTDPKRTHFVWDGSRLLQEYTYKGSYTYIYTDQDSYEPLAQVFDNAKDDKQYLSYFHTDQVGIPREMTDVHGNLLWYGEYTAWGRLKKDGRVYNNAHQPFRLQNQYYDEETGLHYNLMRYYEPEAGRFVNQDPIGLWGGENLYQFADNALVWFDPLGLKKTYAQRLGTAGERSVMRYLEGTGYKKVFSIQNASGNGLDIVALRPDGKYDIFEVKSSKRGKFKLSERQQKGGKCFAEQVLTEDVTDKKKGGYFMKGLGRKKTPLDKKKAQEIFNNIGKTETVFVDMNHKFQATRMTFGPW